ncbi:MAG: hypothetical protein WD069_12420 [Planctomycetales bacterium]
MTEHTAKPRGASTAVGDSRRWDEQSVLDSEYRNIASLTESLFPDAPVTIGNQVDPSDPDSRYTVLNAYAQGTPKELLAKEREWIRRVEESMPECSTEIRLILCPL